MQTNKILIYSLTTIYLCGTQIILLVILSLVEAYKKNKFVLFLY